jgi:peptidyl-dipeptidase A
MGEQAPHRVVSTLEGRIRELETEFRSAYWESQVAATPENERRRAELELELRRVKGDPEALNAVESALQEELHEPELQRQLEVLRLSLTGNQMDETRREAIVELSSSIESDFASHRPLVDHKRVSENEITEILKSSNDEEQRKRAWEAAKEIGELVAERVRELVRLRNATALDLGFADFYSMALELQEISEEWLFSILDELDQLTAEPFVDWKRELDGRLRERFAVDDVMPWHYADPFFQSLPVDGRVELDATLERSSATDLAAKTFSDWGIDLAPMLAASDLYPRENKSQHAFCIDIDRSGEDVRILANVVPGERWVEIMLHESGHAAYDVSLGKELPYFLRRSAHTFVTEAVAILSGRLVHDPIWLQQVAGISPAEVRLVEDALARATRAKILLFARWGLVVTHFERELYQDPEMDLNSRWWELVERFQGVAPPEGRSAPDWAAKIHIAAAPAYYHNYLLGEMLASQLRATFEQECGGLIGAAAVGELLVERVFKPGALLRWDSIVEEATGRGLSARDLAADVGATAD